MLNSPGSPMPLAPPTPKLSLTVDGTVATLAINNPARRNAIDGEMWRALPPLFEALGADPGVRVVVLRGAGEAAFSAGADIAEFEFVRADAAGGRAYEAANEAAFFAVARCPKPVVAMIGGACLGGGFGLALSCDLRIAAENAVFGVPAGRLGIGYPPGAMRLVVAALGLAAAKDLFYTARRMTAAEAFRVGAVQRVVGPGDLGAAVADVARTIARNAPLTLRAAKAAMLEAAGLDAPGDPRAAVLAEACFDSADCGEGRRAFLEKREPAFTGG